MQRLKRRINADKYTKTPERRRSPSASSDSSEELEIVAEAASSSGPIAGKEPKLAWVDSDDSSDEEDASRTERFEKQFGKVPRFLAAKKPRRSESDSSSSEDEDEPSVLKTGQAGRLLAPTSGVSASALAHKNLRDLNADKPAKATVSAVRFHPWSPVALVASTDRTLNLFHVDGDSNAKLSGHYFDHFPLKCARFTPDGKQILLSSIRRSFRILDMQSERVTAVHGLRGVEAPIQQFEISPDGRFAVFIGQRGALHVVELASQEKVATLEANGRVMSLAFADDILCAFGDEGRVYRFCMSNFRLLGSFLDEGCVGGRSLAISPDQGLLACGHSTGVVNLYRHADTFAVSSAPKPLRTAENLVTSCDLLRFGPAGELLFMASSCEYSALRVMHSASGRVLANFPARAAHLGKLSAVDVSPGGGFLALGQTDGRVKLTRLLAYEKI